MTDTWNRFLEAAAAARLEPPPPLDVRGAVLARLAAETDPAYESYELSGDPLRQELLWTLAVGLLVAAAAVPLLTGVFSIPGGPALAWGGLVDPVAWNPWGL